MLLPRALFFSKPRPPPAPPWCARSSSTANKPPGTPSGVNFNLDRGLLILGSLPVLNDAGQTAFNAILTGSGVDSTNSQGIWSEGSGSLAMVARSGSHAPGTPSGVNYFSFLGSGLTSPVLNDAGSTAFRAQLTGSGIVGNTNDTGIWSEGSGSLALVARSGSQAPGTPSGENFSGFGVAFGISSNPIGPPVLNDAGQTAFVGYTSHSAGIWASDRTGALQLIARYGDPLEVAPGDIRTIGGLDFVSQFLFRDGQSKFNNLGQLVFEAYFTDGSSGIFVSNRVASIPEPSTLLLLCFGSLAVLWRRRGLLCAAILVAAVGSTCADHAQAVTIDMVTVGNPGNAPDTRYNSISVGSVDHAFQIGKYEVTAGQYTEFLNAVAKDDPNGLYNTRMGDPSSSSLGANIQQTGSSPNFSYSVAADWANRPVNYVSFWDAARYANWLHNDQLTGPQGPGTTEGGAYHDVGDQVLFGRNPGAKFFIPTEDEWYKAAYHDKAAGLAATYFDYPTGTNTVPGNNINETSNPGNNANYYINDYAIGSPYYRTVVGEFELSDSPYGTFDQGGNVLEWNETAVSGLSGSARGGGFNVRFPDFLRASSRANGGPAFEINFVGFRVASIPAPEPTSFLIAAIGILGLVGSSPRRQR